MIRPLPWVFMVYNELGKNTNHHNTSQVIMSSDEYKKEGTKKCYGVQEREEYSFPPQDNKTGKSNKSERAEIRKWKPQAPEQDGRVWQDDARLLFRGAKTISKNRRKKMGTMSTFLKEVEVRTPRGQRHRFRCRWPIAEDSLHKWVQRDQSP